MLVGLLTIEIFIPDSKSLKSKRFVVQSLKDRLRKKFNVSVAEDANNLWQRTTISVACVSNKKSHLQASMQRIKDMIMRETDFEVINHELEMF
ncbi:hypothetical protein BMS3Abin07_00568 [bacterium BMS3Abin07]|nr:hypothetical protein BMS3Abin07_00568 [bacterium BMS3Abin07]GBE32852.1 hypothetical protein BMS3Bbin05_01780 [bacterium BMS3Bbin05]HDO22400.1 DUF503 domain-containing protein [Nitrospirota bacterium]HDZ88818.1 DUF503 domain-containing protein [Nitrospirota bacterium]